MGKNAFCSHNGVVTPSTSRSKLAYANQANLDFYARTSQAKEAKTFCEYLEIHEVIIYFFIPFLLKNHHELKAVFISIKRLAIVRDLL